ncbi:MAG: PAS domain S-box protein [Patescibacteria group bacterium]
MFPFFWKKKKIAGKGVPTDIDWDAVLERLPLLITQMDRAGHFTHWNAYAEKMTGYSAKEVIGKMGPDDFHPRGEPARIKKAVWSKGKWGGDVSWKRKDGKVTRVRVSVVAADAPGMAKNIVGCVQNIDEQKHLNEALMHERDLSQSYLSLVGVMVVALDTHGRIVFLNEKAASILHISVAKAKGLSWFKTFIPADIRERVEQVYLQIIGGKEKLREYYDNNVLTTKGEQRLIAWHNALLRDENGKVIGTISAGDDVTERRKTEQVLAEERLMFVDGPSVVFKWKNASGWPVEYVSPNVLVRFGYKQQQFLSGEVAYAAIIHPDDGARVEQEVKKYSLSKTTAYFSQAYRIRRADGIYRWVFDFTTIVRDTKGAITHYLGYVQDITEQKENERRLEESEQRFRKVFENASIGFALVRKDGKFLECNDALATLWGYSKKEISRLSIASVTLPDELERNRKALGELAKGEKDVYRVEKIYIRKNGDEIWCHTIAVPIFDEKKNFLYFVALIEDVTEQKRTEQIVQREKEKFRSLVDNSLQGIVIATGFPPKIQFANERLAQILGYSVKELMSFSSKKIQELVYVEDRELFFKNYQVRLQGARLAPSYEFRVVHKDGRTRWIELFSTKIDYEGKPAIQTAFLDITKRKALEEYLRLSESRFHKIFDSTPDGMLLLDLGSGRISDVNPAFVKLVGHARDSMIGRTPWDVGFFQDVEKAKTAFFSLQKTGHEHCELDLLTKQNTVLIAEFTSGTYPINGTVNAFCTVRDVTALRHSQRELKDERDKFDTLLSNIGEGVIAIDQDRRIVYANNRVAQLLGWRVQDIVGKSYQTIWRVTSEAGVTLEKKLRPIELALVSGEPIVTELKDHYFYTHKDGSHFPVIITATPIKQQGKTMGVIVIFRDVTHEFGVDKMKNEFVSLASHQLRTPITSIQWNTEVLMSGHVGALSREQMSIVQELYQSNSRMIDLVNSLLNVSRLESGVFGVEPEPILSQDVVEAVVSDLYPDIHKKSLKVEMDIDAKVQEIRLDKKLLRIIVENLITNAVRYSHEKGGIHIRLHQEGKKLYFSVKDQGIGIPFAQQKLIFQKMYRADNAQQYYAGGSGLGLYIVKLILDQVGGTITFESEEGKGSTFTVALPIKGMEPRKGSKPLV